MADEIRDDGTVICAIHGMRYDPALADGCIKCPRSPGATGRRSIGPRSSAPKGSAPPPSVRVPPSSYGTPSSYGSSNPPPPGLPRLTTPPIPFEPAYLGSNPYQTPYQSQQGGAPVISIMPAPIRRRTSRRGLLQFLTLVIAGGAGTAAWVLSPEGATDWTKKMTTFRYGNAATSVGTLFLPSAAAERACPLLLVLDHAKNATKLLLSYAKHCEEHGWIAATTDAFGRGASSDDNADAALFLEQVRANANVDGARAIISGYDDAADAACRLGILEPKLFSGAILTCCPNRSWHEVGAMASRDVAFDLITRQSDSDHEDMVTMKDEMQRKGIAVAFDEIGGKHSPLDRDEMEPVFAWMELHRG